MRRLLFSTLVLFLMLGAGGTALGCDCLTLSPSESFKEADFVFEGLLIGSNQSGHDIAYEFRVRKVLKGAHVANVTLIEGLSNCDANFSPSIIYRVYARSVEGRLSSSSCFANVMVGAIRITPQRVTWSTLLRRLWSPKPFAVVGICLVAFLIIVSIRRKLSVR